MYDVIIIGAGTSGLMCGMICKNAGMNVLILEKEDEIAKKLCASGNGRCNVTNTCKKDQLLKAINGNSKFMMSAFSKFDNFRIIEFFEKNNIPLHEEQNGRVFPKSNKAQDIVNLFKSELSEHIKVRTKVTNITKNQESYNVITNKNEIFNCKSLVLACGGKTYPELSGTTSGYQLSKKLDHSIIEPFSICTPFVFKNADDQLMGTTLENVNVYIESKNKKKLLSTQNVLFTHYGITGPAIFEASYAIQKHLQEKNEATIFIGMKISFEILKETLSNNPNKHFTNVVKGFTSRYLKWISTQISLNDIKNSQLSEKQIQLLCDALNHYPYTISNAYNEKHGFVTAGGVNLKEISPQTMMSKLHENLYIIGELLDLQAITGGYNITIALSSGYSAAQSIIANK